MLVLIGLLALELTFFFINYLHQKKDLYSPSVIVFVSLFGGTFFSFIGLNTIGDSVCMFTIVVFVSGMIAVTIGSFISIRISFFSWFRHGRPYLLNGRIIFISTILSILLTLLYGIEAYMVGIEYGGTGYNTFAYMKQAYLDNSSIKMNFFVRQGFKVVLAIAYVNTLYLIRNLVNIKKTKINFFLGLSIFCALAIVIFSGSRTEILRIFSFAILVWGVLYREKTGWTVNDNRDASKKIGRLIPVAILFLALFYLTRWIVKTDNVESSNTNSIIFYLAYYIGGAFFVLNNKIDLSFDSLSEMFVGNDVAKNIAPSHVYLGTLNYGGNTATLFEGVLYMGLVGMVLYLIFVYFILTSLYKSALLKTETNFKRDAALIVLGLLYFQCVMAFYSDCTQIAVDNSSLIILALCILYYRISSKRFGVRK